MAVLQNNILAGAAGQTGGAAAADYVVPKSLRFNKADGANLQKTFASAGNRRTFTHSFWVKRSSSGSQRTIFSGNTTGSFNNGWQITIENADTLSVNGASPTFNLTTSRVLRDQSAWYHIVVSTDTTQPTASDRLKIYINGEQVTEFGTSNYPSQNDELNWNRAALHEIGGLSYTSNVDFDGYLADIQIVDGVALTANDFGETRDTDGVWVPKEFTRTSPNDGTVFSNSVSNAGNDPKNLFDGGQSHYVEGSTDGTPVTWSGNVTGIDKLEFYGNQAGSSRTFSVNGVDKLSLVPTSPGWFTVPNVTTLTAFSYSRGGSGNYVDLFAVRVNGEVLEDGLNNSSGYGRNGAHLNFSDSSTNEALGFDSAPTIPDLDPKKGMDIVTWTGNSTGQRNIGGLGFEPDFVWIKRRNASYGHLLMDSVRGFNSSGHAGVLYANATNAEDTGNTQSIRSFNPDGFSLGTDGGVNYNNSTYVGWCWRAGGPAVANTDGSITSQVSANTDHGFSIVTYTGTSASTNTIGHGLGSAPKFIILKSYSDADNWFCYHNGIDSTSPEDYDISLNTTGARRDYHTWNDTAPTSSVFSVGNTGASNENGRDYVAYCWSEVSGYSKFGSYSGTGANGNKQTVGFKPRWVLIKGTDSTYDWQIFDSERNPSNPRNLNLEPNTSDAEATTGNNVSFHDDGFSFNTNSDKLNGSSKNYIYAVFADRPGNNWDVNNLVTNEGLSTNKDNFDVVTYSGNGGVQNIGGEVYSSTSSITVNNSNSLQAGSLAGVFNGTQTANSSNAYGFTNGAMDFTWTPDTAISYSSKVRVWTGFSGGSVYLNGGSAVSTQNNNWTTLVSGSSGTITSIRFTVGQSGGWWAGLEVDDVVLIDSTPGLKFQPDFVWIKSRSSGTEGHYLANSVNGLTKNMRSNATSAEQTNANGVTGAHATGFTLGDSGRVNGSSQTYVAWCWKAGGTAVSNTDGSITSSVSANVANGFSIVNHVGTGANGTFGHGLSKAPDLMIFKNRAATDNWFFWSRATDGTATTGGVLNSTNAFWTNGANELNSTVPTDSVVHVGSNLATNGNNQNVITYCFHDVPGYQRIGSWIGNGSSTGPVIVTGFRPKFLLFKRTDGTANWYIYDTERDAGNPVNEVIPPNTTSAEYTMTSMNIDFLDNGFQLKGVDGDMNNNGSKYIYLAIGDDEIGSDEDCLVDVPNAVTADADATDTTGGYQRGNYATLNPLQKSSGATLSNGNLDISMSSAQGMTFATMAFPASGKWYFECTATGTQCDVGIAKADANLEQYIGKNTSGYGYYVDGDVYTNDYSVGSGDAYTTGDVVGVAFDADTGTCRWYKNGSLQITISSLSGQWFPGFGSGNAAGSLNFGQMRFKYPIPDGYKALNTTALPAATIADGSAHFDAKFWTGNGSSQTISGYGFSPDLAWIKSRSETRDHALFTTIQGVQKRLQSNTNDAEQTSDITLTAFTSDGFTLGGQSRTNASNQTYVGWAWDAGSSTVNNTDGNITSQVRANQSAGFSIVKFAGPSSAGFQSVGHGLNAKPELIICKDLDNARNWSVYHKVSQISDVRVVPLNQDVGAFNSGTATWDISEISNTTFTPYFRDDYGASFNADNIAYCFAPVEGYSAFGSFEGGNPFVYLGFKPALIFCKSIDSNSRNWMVFDNTRSPDNPGKEYLTWNGNGTEGTYNACDFLSNGFKVRASSTQELGFSGETFIYGAWAANPFSANGGLAV